MDYKEQALKAHKEWNGKLETISKAPVKDNCIYSRRCRAM